jgi:hypothetical protein
LERELELLIEEQNFLLDEDDQDEDDDYEESEEEEAEEKETEEEDADLTSNDEDDDDSDHDVKPDDHDVKPKDPEKPNSASEVVVEISDEEFVPPTEPAPRTYATMSWPWRRDFPVITESDDDGARELMHVMFPCTADDGGSDDSSLASSTTRARILKRRRLG